MPFLLDALLVINLLNINFMYKKIKLYIETLISLFIFLIIDLRLFLRKTINMHFILLFITINFYLFFFNL